MGTPLMESSPAPAGAHTVVDVGRNLVIAEQIVLGADAVLVVTVRLRAKFHSPVSSR
jgi:hypothetical protein